MRKWRPPSRCRPSRMLSRSWAARCTRPAGVPNRRPPPTRCWIACWATDPRLPSGSGPTHEANPTRLCPKNDPINLAPLTFFCRHRLHSSRIHGQRSCFVRVFKSACSALLPVSILYLILSSRHTLTRTHARSQPKCRFTVSIECLVERVPPRRGRCNFL